MSGESGDPARAIVPA